MSCDQPHCWLVIKDGCMLPTLITYAHYTLDSTKDAAVVLYLCFCTWSQYSVMVTGKIAESLEEFWWALR